MFGFRRRKIVRAVVPFVRSNYVSAFDTLHVPGFWDDDYVLGFLSGTIAFLVVHIQTEALIRPQDSQLQRILFDAMHELCGRENMERGKFHSLASQPTVEFLAGMAAADKVHSIVKFGDEDFKNDPDVVLAREEAIRSMPKRLDGESSQALSTRTAGLLSRHLFFENVTGRLMRSSPVMQD